MDAGGKVGGFDCYTTSNVLRGSGLSSSAAFEVCIGAILRGEYNNNDMEKFNQVKIAQIGQFAENVFFGKPCGLMDQTACAVGGVITIDFKDPAHPVVGQTAIDLAKHGFVMCISDTKGSHADLTDDYAAIRHEMESVAEQFGKRSCARSMRTSSTRLCPSCARPWGTALSCVRCTSITTAAAPPSSATPCARTILKRSCA